MRNLVIGLAFVAIGFAVGIGLFTFVYAEGASYLVDDPAACANCHVMNPQYQGWVASSHRHVAGCNDCHTPHSFLSKYYVKAENGFWHSFYFTTGRFQEPIRIREKNRRVTERTCRECHGDIVRMIDHGPEEMSCIRCHGSVGHPTER